MCVQYARVVLKSYGLEVCLRSTSDEFISRLIIRNCWQLHYGKLFQ